MIIVHTCGSCTFPDMTSAGYCGREAAKQIIITHQRWHHYSVGDVGHLSRVKTETIFRVSNQIQKLVIEILDIGASNYTRLGERRHSSARAACPFYFTYAKSRFSHEITMAHLIISIKEFNGSFQCKAGLPTTTI